MVKRIEEGCDVSTDNFAHKVSRLEDMLAHFSNVLDSQNANYRTYMRYEDPAVSEPSGGLKNEVTPNPLDRLDSCLNMSENILVGYESLVNDLQRTLG